MISASTSPNSSQEVMVEALTFDLPASPTLRSVFVEVRHCGDKALVIDQPHYHSR